MTVERLRTAHSTAIQKIEQGSPISQEKEDIPTLSSQEQSCYNAENKRYFSFLMHNICTSTCTALFTVILTDPMCSFLCTAGTQR
jgi:hypothetical protein